jgi:hypothetical protein
LLTVTYEGAARPADCLAVISSIDRKDTMSVRQSRLLESLLFATAFNNGVKKAHAELEQYSERCGIFKAVRSEN